MPSRFLTSPAQTESNAFQPFSGQVLAEGVYTQVKVTVCSRLTIPVQIWLGDAIEGLK